MHKSRQYFLANQLIWVGTSMFRFFRYSLFLLPVNRGRDGGCLRPQPMYVEERGHYLYRSHGVSLRVKARYALTRLH